MGCESPRDDDARGIFQNGLSVRLCQCDAATARVPGCGDAPNRIFPTGAAVSALA
jgi:hypothetical protein